ncbi:hypothetical protein [Cysteiniphilum halobium]|uniref:hypothetical protein n=1 Tax=Cysteiniphilum halobium TaxID=2219059 RepID=UPI003F873683
MEYQKLLEAIKAITDEEIKSQVIDSVGELEAEYKSKLMDLAKDNSDLEEAFNEAIKIAEEYKSQHESDNQQINDLNEVLIKNQQQFDKVIKDFYQENELLQDNNFKLQDELNNIGNKFNKMESVLSLKKGELETVEFQLAEVKNERQELLTQHQKSEKKLIKDIEEKNNKLKEKAELIDVLGERVDQLTNSNQKHQQEVFLNQKKVEELNKENNALRKESTDKDLLIEKLRNELKALKGDLDDTKQALNDEKQANAEMTKKPSESNGLTLDEVLKEQSYTIENVIRESFKAPDSINTDSAVGKNFKEASVNFQKEFMSSQNTSQQTGDFWSSYGSSIAAVISAGAVYAVASIFATPAVAGLLAGASGMGVKAYNASDKNQNLMPNGAVSDGNLKDSPSSQSSMKMFNGYESTSDNVVKHDQSLQIR